MKKFKLYFLIWMLFIFTISSVFVCFVDRLKKVEFVLGFISLIGIGVYSGGLLVKKTL